MKLLITGGSGFIGTNAVEYFSKKGYAVLNIDIKPPQNRDYDDSWFECDILDYEKYKKAVFEFDPDYFLHLAARTDLHERKNIDGYAANTEGLSNTIRIIRNHPKIQKVIFASSRMVCRIDYVPKNMDDYCPPNLYGESKVIGENLVKKSGLECDWVIVRPTSIWGPWFDVPYKVFFSVIKKGVYFHPGNLNPKKSFGYVGNTVYQIDKLFQSIDLMKGKVTYLCDYPPLELREWAEMINKEMGLKKISSLPYAIQKIFGLIGDMCARLGWQRVPITSFRLRNLITDMVYNVDELHSICGVLPVSLEDGVRITVEWMNKHEQEFKG